MGEQGGDGRGRVCVVGCGHVGATSAYALMTGGLAREIVLLDADRRRAEGEAMDLQQAAPGLPVERVIGSGTVLDSARLRTMLGESLGVEPRSIHAHIIGEHGDSEIAAWSSARVAGVGLREFCEAEGRECLDFNDLLRRVRRAAPDIIERKGQVDETRARVLIAEKKYREAERIMAGVTKTLERGGEYALLADALRVQGVAWARLGASDSSINILRQAMRIGQESGALTNAGLAALTLIEEHGAAWRLSESELAKVYRRADELLKDTQDAEDITRLRECARIIIRRLSGMQLHDKNFNFYGAVHELEARLIEQALELEDGSVSRAAKRLGLKHQSLSHMLHARHKKLTSKRTPPTLRRRSIIKKDA